MNEITLLAPGTGEEVSLLDAVQLAYLASERKSRKAEIQGINVEDPDFQERDRSRPLPVVFRWHCGQIPEEDFLLEISANPLFREKRSFRLPCFSPGVDMNFMKTHGCNGRADVRNLIPGSDYFWRVSAGMNFTSSVGTFRTADQPPRLIAIPGMVNVRDIGGWKSSFGGKIRYGKLYRGSSLDNPFRITTAGEKVFLEDLKIRTELDLRGLEAGFVPPGVQRNVFAMSAYGNFGVDGKGIFSAEQMGKNRDIFELLNREDTAPFYCHCAGGSDRTGTLVLLLEAVLGISDEDLCTDYELTSLSCLGERSRNNEYFQSLIRGLHTYSGKTLSECAVCYLTECGVPESLIWSLREKWLVKA